MKVGLCMLGALAGFAFAAPAFAATPAALMGVAIGNTVIIDYGQQGKVIANFNVDGTVDFTFPNGEKSNQRWIADANFICTMKATDEETAFTYRCERNMIAGKKLGQHWHYVDSTGAPATVTVQPRSS